MSLGVVMTLLALDLGAQQTTAVRPPQPESAASTQTGTAAITGTVVDAITGRAVAGAVVTLEERPTGTRARAYAQVTTPTGRFAFIDLPASDGYFLTTAKPGYLDGGYGRLHPRGPSAPLAVGESQWLRDVRVTMSPPGSISGTVVDERGEPIVGAHVRVLPQVLIAGRTQWLAGAVARTDDRGAYRIHGLGPGKYLVSVPSVQATLPASAAVKAPGALAGTSMADLRAAGDAARAERLVVDVGGGQQLVVGRYSVPPPPTPDGLRTAYPIVFYPNVASPIDAMPINLRISEDRSGVDFQLLPARTARVSGAVQGPPEAVGNLLLRLIPVGLEDLGQGSEAATTVSLADGRFTFLDVPSGSYVLDSRHALLEFTHTSMTNVPTVLPAPVPFSARSATSSGVRAAPPGVEFQSLRDGADVSYWGQTRVEVPGRDVTDVVLSLRRPVKMSGRIEWTPGSTPTTLSLIPILEPADGRRSLGVLTPIGSAREGSFVFEGLMAGEYFLRVGIGGGSGRVESIRWEGQDYTDRPFDASAGRDFIGVVLALTDAASSISGAVTDNGAALTGGAAVIAFPVARERWSNYGLNPTRIASVLTTSDGRYRLDGLPTGEYFLIAVPASQERAWLDPAFLTTHAAGASRVRVERSDARIQNVMLGLLR